MYRSNEIEKLLSEEKLNTITHGFGALCGIVATVILSIETSEIDGFWRKLSAVTFGICFMIVYTTSTIYHGTVNPRWKEIFQTLDHSAIYLMIAGTYTPLGAYSAYHYPWGKYALIGIWLLASIGIFFKFKYTKRNEVYSTLIYLIMGWGAILAVKPLFHVIETPGKALIIIGGLVYTLGTIFYLWRRIPYSHAIWHMFAVGGSVCHFFAIYRYIIPLEFD
ncbi:PAQR family membrane homeostasis protein TrhA [Aureibacter tunicatorum]|uniref:Hemolysin III n=1 Tax=Aureibacter tunicatorum TaxID=866807 RepID=A0AAE4BRP1_9BACT|nr:hemolysin III family protein [Aureibacter tunicatorum]MDR6237417.1 hemolysin III [Aureibacter tunicatorum]BDD06407.1 hemolysin III family protein [Aureibacter tunicatorum]